MDTGKVDGNTGKKIFKVKVNDPDNIWKCTIKRQFALPQTMIQDCYEFQKTEISFTAVP